MLGNVTDEHDAPPPPLVAGSRAQQHPGGRIIAVQPLKREEMQVSSLSIFSSDRSESSYSRLPVLVLAGLWFEQRDAWRVWELHQWTRCLHRTLWCYRAFAFPRSLYCTPSADLAVSISLVARFRIPSGKWDDSSSVGMHADTSWIFLRSLGRSSKVRGIKSGIVNIRF